MQIYNKYNKGLEGMGKKEKLKNVFDELFGSLEHCRFWDRMRVSLGNLNPQGLFGIKENA
jgi:hypothetical protein